MSSSLTSSCHSASLAANTAWAAAEGPAWSVFLPSRISRRRARRRSRGRGVAGGVMGRELTLSLAGLNSEVQLLIGRHSGRTTCTCGPRSSAWQAPHLSGVRAYGLPQIGGLAQVSEPPPVISPHQLLAPFGSPVKLIQASRDPRWAAITQGGRKGFMRV